MTDILIRVLPDLSIMAIMDGFEGAGFPESHGLPLIILLLGYLVLDQSRMVLLDLAMLFRNLRSRREAGERAEQHQQEIRGNQ